MREYRTSYNAPCRADRLYKPGNIARRIHVGVQPCSARTGEAMLLPGTKTTANRNTKSHLESGFCVEAKLPMQGVSLQKGQTYGRHIIRHMRTTCDARCMIEKPCNLPIFSFPDLRQIRRMSSADKRTNIGSLTDFALPGNFRFLSLLKEGASTKGLR